MASIGPQPASVIRGRHWFALEAMAYAAAPFVVVVSILGLWLHAGGENVGFDLRNAFLPAARDVLDGASPYPLPGDPEIAGQHAYVYSPVVAYALVPLTVLPDSVAVFVGACGSFVAALVALALVGVRDWRCYGLMLMWPPVLNSVSNVSVSLPLAVLAAAAWRWRDRELSSGALLGVAVAVKTFVWPLLLWPACTRRFRGALTGVAVATVLALGTWALLGFAGLRDYPDLLRAVTDLEERESYSLSGALLELGAGPTIARGAMVAVTAGLLALAVRFGRHGDERRAFVAVILASLAATPILWQHYLTFLLVALAVARPRLSLAWFLPFAFYGAPWTGNGRLWQTVLVPLVTALIGATCLMTVRRSLRSGRDVSRPYSSSPKRGVSTSPSA
jgi:hypothetical protein